MTQKRLLKQLAVSLLSDFDTDIQHEQTYVPTIVNGGKKTEYVSLVPTYSQQNGTDEKQQKSVELISLADKTTEKKHDLSSPHAEQQQNVLASVRKTLVEREEDLRKLRILVNSTEALLSTNLAPPCLGLDVSFKAHLRNNKWFFNDKSPRSRLNAQAEMSENPSLRSDYEKFIGSVEKIKELRDKIEAYTKLPKFDDANFKRDYNKFKADFDKFCSSNSSKLDLYLEFLPAAKSVIAVCGEKSATLPQLSPKR